MITLNADALTPEELKTWKKSLSSTKKVISLTWSPTPPPSPEPEPEFTPPADRKDLWDFLPGDPKLLGYILTVYNFNSDYSQYQIDKQVFKFIHRILDDDADDTVGYTDPQILLDEVKIISDTGKSKLDQLISQDLNPQIMTYDQALPYLEGLVKYLKYAIQNHYLVRLNWA